MSEGPRRWARIGGWSGLLGSAAFVVAGIVTAVAYTGSQGEPYSPLNHYVSELGEPAHSELAALFNAGIWVGGASLAIFMVALGRVVGGTTAAIAGGIGAAAGLFGIAVGFLPMGVAIHGLVALGYFGLAAIALSIFTLLRPPIVRGTAVAVAAIVTVAALLAYIALYLTSTLGPDWRETRAVVALDATIEWISFAALIGWVLLVSRRLLVAEAAVPDPPIAAAR